MARQNLENNTSYGTIRGQINDNFTELYADKGDKAFTEQNYITDGESTTDSLDALDIEAKDINDRAGTLASLATTDKTSLVNAVNEVDGRVGVNESNISLLQTEVSDAEYTAEVETYEQVTHLDDTILEGQIKALLEGNLYTNLVDNPDFANGTTGWGVVFGTVSVSDGIATITGDGSNTNLILYPTTLGRIANLNDKLLVYTKATKPSLATQISIQLFNALATTNAQTTDGNSYYVVTLDRDYTDLRIGVRAYFSNTTDQNGSELIVEKVFAVNLTALQETSTDLSYLEQAYRFIVGTQMSKPKMIKSVTQNLFDKNDITEGFYLGGTGTLSLVDATTFVSNYIPVKAGVTYYKSSSVVDSRTRYELYDSSKVFTGEVDYAREFTPTVDGWVRFGDYLTALDTLQLVEGTTAPSEYIPYDESKAYIPVEQASLPNGTKDSFNINTGERVKRVSDVNEIATTDYDSIDTATYTNVDVVKTIAYANAVAGTTALDGNTVVVDSDDKMLSEVSQANIDLTTSYGKYYYHTDKTIWFIVEKGTYADIVAARTGLGTSEAYYQLSEPVTTYYPPQNIKTFENGTIYVLDLITDTKSYDSGITVDYDIDSIESLYLVDGETKTAVDISDTTITTNSFTISGASADEVYEVTYSYASSTSTNSLLTYQVPANINAQVLANSNAISRTSMSLEELRAYQNLVNLELDARITALETP